LSFGAKEPPTPDFTKSRPRRKGRRRRRKTRIIEEATARSRSGRLHLGGLLGLISGFLASESLYRWRL
jgi:hypothetical protein